MQTFADHWCLLVYIRGLGRSLSGPTGRTPPAEWACFQTRFMRINPRSIAEKPAVVSRFDIQTANRFEARQFRTTGRSQGITTMRGEVAEWFNAHAWKA
jgi:hypothetical protein